MISLCQGWWDELLYHYVRDGGMSYDITMSAISGMSYDITVSEMVGSVIISLCQRWWDEL